MGLQPCVCLVHVSMKMCSSRQATEIVHPSIPVHIDIFIHPFVLLYLLGLIHCWSPAPLVLAKSLRALRNHTSHHKPAAIFTRRGPLTKIAVFGSVCLGEIDSLMIYTGCELSEFATSKTSWLGLGRIGVDWWYREHDWFGLSESVCGFEYCGAILIG